MDTTSDDDQRIEADRPVVTAHSSGTDRTVFTEDGNRDGWIASDLTLDLRR